MNRLTGKVAIITGAARGMGAATARLFAAEGAKVVILDVLEKDGAALAAELGERAFFRRHDVSSESDWQATCDEALDRFGRIDVLVNNAATIEFKTIADTDKATLERILSVNLIGPFLGIKVIGPVLAAQKSGSIVNISSTVAFSGQHGTGAYVVSKWGVRGLSKVAALEYGHQGVRVNTVFPGGTNTPMANVLGMADEELNGHFKQQPIQRIGKPEEVASVSLFLASDESSYLCGAELVVDGGMLLGPYNPALPGGPAAA